MKEYFMKDHREMFKEITMKDIIDKLSKSLDERKVFGALEKKASKT